MTNQFLAYQNWTREILVSIKKDIKSDHLHTDPLFYRTYFGNRPQNRLTAEEIYEAYEKELIKGNESLAEWVVNRWVFKNGDLYQRFAERLGEINPEFDQIQSLTQEQSQKVLQGIVESFGAIPTFLFSFLNGVVFPESILKDLEKRALKEKEERENRAKEEEKEQDLERLIANHQRELARMQDKIDGVLKKYTKDTEGLKKQIRILQQKLAGN